MLIYLPFLFILTLITSWLVNAESSSAFIDVARCPHQPYKIHIFSRRPLVIYVENFVSLDEAAQLISLAELSYHPSEVVSPDAKDGRAIKSNTTARRSNSTALYSKDSPLIDCLRERAATFQGLSAHRLEPLQVVRYAPNGFFKHHYDWLSHVVRCRGDYFCEKGMGDRESTFFVYLQADCEGGETDFPSLNVPRHIDEGAWSRFVDWQGGGLKFKPKAGNAIFWENLDEGGKGIRDVLHAGLPVKDGSKIGLNIWTRQRVPRPCAGVGDDKCETYIVEEHDGVQAIVNTPGGHEEL